MMEDLLLHLCDSFQSEQEQTEKPCNFLGNTVVFSTERNLSFAVGSAISGVRSGALIQQNHFSDHLPGLTYAVKQHVPLVVHVASNNRETLSDQTDVFAKIRSAGAIGLMSASQQEALDHAIIAHRISELALVPVVHFLPLENKADDLQKVDDAALTNYLGKASDHIESPVPAQQWVFGPRRRTMPNWFSADVPTMNGALKKPLDLELGTVAEAEFFQSHFQELIQRAFDEFATISGRKHQSFDTYRSDGAKTLFITYGEVSTQARKATDKIKKVGLIDLKVLNPFTSDEIKQLVRGRTAVVIEPIISKLFLFNSVGQIMSDETVSLQFGETPTAEDLVAAFGVIRNSDKDLFYLNIDLTRSTSEFPKHAILLNNIGRNYPESGGKTVRSKALGPGHVDKMNIPLSVRQFKDQGPSYSSVSRFYNETGIFHHSGQTDQLVADPFQAINSFPSATSSFSRIEKRTHLPVFNPTNTHDSIDLAVMCPNAAMPTLSISMEALIKAGAALATANGASISKMTPVVKNLAKMANRFMASDGAKIACVNDVLPKAFEDLAQATKLEAEKYDTLSVELKAILEQIGHMSIALTDPLFFGPESIEKGKGEIFTMAFDTNACTGCGLCAAHCNNREITMESETKELLTETDRQFKLWEQLPDTTGETISRLIHEKTCDPFAAIMLSRNFYLSMGGSARSEGEAQRTLLHMVTATAESALQSVTSQKAGQIQELIAGLKEQIQKELAAGLPKEDLSGLQKAIEKSGSEHMPFDQIIAQAGNTVKMKLMDTEALNRKLSVIKDLETLNWTLTEGPTGTGRARYGLVIHGKDGLNWAQAYPYNPFTGPTVVHSDHSTPEMVLGLFEGQKTQILNNLKLLRRAGLEAKGKYNPKVNDSEIATLKWADLTDEERSMLPPIILVTDHRKLMMNGGWNRLLLSDDPIKVVLMHNGDLPVNDHAPQIIQQQASLLISAISLKKAFVMQAAAADHVPLFEGLIEGLRSNGPSLFILNTPDRSVHTEAWQRWSGLAKLAVATRAHYQAKFNAKDTTDFLSNGIDIGLNPEYGKPWMNLTLSYKKDGEDVQDTYAPTWADHAFTLKGWQGQFAACEYGEDRIPIADYLKLSPADRKSKKAVVKMVIDGELKLYQASDLVVRTTEAISESWHTLQEMAGVLTPYPEKLRKEVEVEIKTVYDKELASAKADFEAKSKEQEAQQMEVFRQRLKAKLVALSLRGSVKQ